ncbi:MAG: primosomal protein N' [Planctomycetota bacterium]|nr:MAG: primosomal protein N' [Planctomycetota bacterium]
MTTRDGHSGATAAPAHAAPAAQSGGALAEVALPVPLPQTFHYLVPAELSDRVAPGHRVRVPFGRRRLVGIVLGRLELAASAVPEERLRPIAEAPDTSPCLPPGVLELCRFAARYYRVPLGEVLEAALPGAVRQRRRRLVPADTDASPPAAGAAAAGGAAALPPLTAEQARALATVLEDVRAGRFGVTLLHGITGSGKTEVYLRAIGETLALGRQALLLVPEIALTPQTLARIGGRFPRVAVLHSLLGARERALAWEQARRGRVDVVLGPRSAVFAPLERLGLIVVDEEHEPSFKQESSPRYHARDLAIARARLEGAAVVLGSATPSLESWYNARRGRYRYAVLRARPGGAVLPRVEVVDLRQESREVQGFPFISRVLERHLAAALARGEQAILFLNRRGFSTFLQCRGCGHVLTCGGCAVALTYHKRRGQALCHACERALPPPSVCPACGAGRVQYFGFGTERIEEEVHQRLPGTRCVRLDSDALAEGAGLAETLERFARGQAQVLVGTQMVARGLDFPRVTVVGVISADTALNLPDFRAAERTFQLLAQVAGRAGRAELPGVTVIQTFCPEHPAVRMAVAHDTEGFLVRELQARRRLGYPPFGRLVRVVLSGPRERRTLAAAEELAARLRAAAGAQAAVLGPAPCPLALLHGRYRFMLLVKAPSRTALAPALEALAAAARPPHGVRIALDIDPVSMM